MSNKKPVGRPFKETNREINPELFEGLISPEQIREHQRFGTGQILPSIDAQHGRGTSGRIVQAKVIDYKRDIRNQILGAQSEDSFTREVVFNAKEAGARICKFFAINPELVGLEGFNKVKLAHLNDGKGMTKEVLEKVGHFSSSHGKDTGPEGNKGKGEKLSGILINSKGMVWISCAFDKQTGLRKIYRMHLKYDTTTGEYGPWAETRLDPQGNPYETTVVDITDEIDLEALGLDIDEDFTLKIYCGQEMNQNTVTHPYGPSDEASDGWLCRELAKRLPILDDNFTIQFGHKKLVSDFKGKTKNFVPIFDTFVDLHNDLTNDFHFETTTLKYDNSGKVISKESQGQTIPFVTNANEVNITYVIDPYSDIGKSFDSNKCLSWYKSRMGTSGTSSGVLFTGELFSYKGQNYHKRADGTRVKGNSWRTTAKQVGITEGYDQIRRYVSLPSDGTVSMDDNRVKLKRNTSLKEDVDLKDYSDDIKIGMPDTIRNFIQALKPEKTNEERQQKLTDIMKKVAKKERASRNDNKGGKDISNTNPNSDKQLCLCPKCKKNKVVTQMKRGQRKCHICGYVKPVQKSKPIDGLYTDKDGRLRTKKTFPIITDYTQEKFSKSTSRPEYKHMVGEYCENEHELKLNIGYEGFKLLIDILLENVPKSNTSYDMALKDAEEVAKDIIIDKCLGPGMMSAFIKYSTTGYAEQDFDNEFPLSLTKPQSLNVYADTWMFDETLYKSEKNKLSKDYGTEGIGIDTSSDDLSHSFSPGYHKHVQVGEMA